MVAQADYPVKPIKVIVPFSPGGAVDGQVRHHLAGVVGAVGDLAAVEVGGQRHKALGCKPVADVDDARSQLTALEMGMSVIDRWKHLAWCQGRDPEGHVLQVANS